MPSARQLDNRNRLPYNSGILEILIHVTERGGVRSTVQSFARTRTEIGEYTLLNSLNWTKGSK